MTPEERSKWLIATDPEFFYRQLIITSAKFEIEPTETHYHEVMWLSGIVHKMYIFRGLLITK